MMSTFHVKQDGVSRPSGEGTEGFRGILYSALCNGKLFLARKLNKCSMKGRRVI